MSDLSWRELPNSPTSLWREIEKLKRQRQKVTSLKIPEDPVEFFEKILHITPFPYQAEFLRDSSPLKVLRWCRRAGKTTTVSYTHLTLPTNREV